MFIALREVPVRESYNRWSPEKAGERMSHPDALH
jgi:hypothetical protein